jgi:hypothetical protein
MRAMTNALRTPLLRATQCQEVEVQISSLKYRRRLAVSVFLTIALTSFSNNANLQTVASGAVWVDINGNVVGPALDNQTILLKIPSVGHIVLPVDIPVFPTTFGDPIRWKYRFGNQTVPAFPLVMSFVSSDCSGQGYLLALRSLTIGNTVQVEQYFDSVRYWLVVARYPRIDLAPQFNSQLVQGSGFPPLVGPGAFCQTVGVWQGGPVVPVTDVIDQQTWQSPELLLQ